MKDYFTSLNVSPELVCKFDHLEIGGCSMITDWSDCDGFIEMKPFTIDMTWDEFQNYKYEDFINLIKSKINDNGYGCKEIVGAHIWIKAVYTDNIGSVMKRYIDNHFISISRELTKEDIEQINYWYEDLD